MAPELPREYMEDAIRTVNQLAITRAELMEAYKGRAEPGRWVACVWRSVLAERLCNVSSIESSRHKEVSLQDVSLSCKRKQ